jgi:hypothetical protein
VGEQCKNSNEGNKRIKQMRDGICSEYENHVGQKLSTKDVRKEIITGKNKISVKIG